MQITVILKLESPVFFVSAPDRILGGEVLNMHLFASIIKTHVGSFVYLCMDVCVCVGGGAGVCVRERKRESERERERVRMQQTQKPATLFKSKATLTFSYAHTCVPHIPKTRRMRGLRSFEPFGLPLRVLFPPCVSPCYSRRVRALSA